MDQPDNQAAQEIQALREIVERQRLALQKAKEMLMDLPGSYWDGDKAVKDIEEIEQGKVK